MNSNKEKFIKALIEARGVVSIAANNAGLSRSTVYSPQWQEDPELMAAWEDAKESAIDHVESKLMQLIDGITVQGDDQDGEPAIYTDRPCKTSIIFYLKTQGKARGYTERTEVEQVNQIQVSVETVGKDPGE